MRCLLRLYCRCLQHLRSLEHLCCLEHLRCVDHLRCLEQLRCRLGRGVACGVRSRVRLWRLCCHCLEHLSYW